jgi:hypothetical protein
MTQDRAYEPGRDTRVGENPTGGAPGKEDRLVSLESQVQILAEAVRALVQGLEENPSEDTRLEETARRGARLAHELLLSRGL